MSHQRIGGLNSIDRPVTDDQEHAGAEFGIIGYALGFEPEAPQFREVHGFTDSWRLDALSLEQGIAVDGGGHFQGLSAVDRGDLRPGGFEGNIAARGVAGKFNLPPPAAVIVPDGSR